MNTVYASTRRTCILLMAAALITGCAVSNTKIRDDSLAVGAGDKAGYLVGSIGIIHKGTTKSDAGVNQLRLRNVETGGRFTLTFSSGMFHSPADFSDDEMKATVFRIQLPPGQYEIYKAFFSYYDGYTTATYENKSNFSLPFRIDPDKEVYIGEYIATRIPVKNFLGIHRAVGYRFDIADRQDRDFAVLKGKYPEFLPSAASVSIPASAIIIDPPDFVIVSRDDAPPVAEDDPES